MFTATLSSSRHHSDDVYASHVDKNYIYRLGICVSPDPEYSKDCAVVQMEEVNSTTLHCIGKLANTQVSVSEWCRQGLE